MSEFDLIKQCFVGLGQARSDILLGIGDDAAVVRPLDQHDLVVSVDTLISGVHFPVDTPAEQIGHKALAVNLSDIAAMGAIPAWVTLALTLPAIDMTWVENFCEGFDRLAQQHQVSLIGGDTTQGALSVTVQIAGYVPPGQVLTRAGALPGDNIYVTGTIGDAGLGLLVYQDKLIVNNETVRCQLMDKLAQPIPRIAEGSVLRGLASAAIDISDGLAQDLAHILEQSHTGAEIFVEKLPVSSAFYQHHAALGGWQFPLTAGDDYELCFTVPLNNIPQLTAMLAAQPQLAPMTWIGQVTDKTGELRCVMNDGSELSLGAKGYKHFS